MKKSLSKEMIMKALDIAYDKAVNGITGLDTAEDMAIKYKEGRSLNDAVDALIKRQVLKAGASGFITGISGLLTMPVSLPTNLISVLYIQIRMVAAIAYMGGYDLRDEKVKTFIYLCMAGNKASKLLKEIGVNLTQKLTIKIINSISEKVILSVNEKVSYGLLSKLGEQGVVNIGKAVPIIGGLIGGGFDATMTKIIGKTAKKLFIDNE
jgi:uncharacterized protein (DUF697 family)